MKYSIGIFSRSDERDYAWLKTVLSSRDFSDCVQNVRSTMICNSGFLQLLDDASQCSLGILYHTKNRGIINITNVDGSLYDEELDSLYGILGRDNVIVVVDDVEDSSHNEMLRILEQQPSIEKYACGLLLVSKTEKKNTRTIMTKLRDLTPFQSMPAPQGSTSYRDPDPQSARSNLKKSLTFTTKYHSDRDPDPQSARPNLKKSLTFNTKHHSDRNPDPQSARPKLGENLPYTTKHHSDRDPDPQSTRPKLGENLPYTTRHHSGRDPDPQSTRPNLEEILTCSTTPKSKTDGLKLPPIDIIPNRKPLIQVMKSLGSNESSEVSMSNEGFLTYNDYVGLKAIRENSAPHDILGRSEMQCSNPYNICNYYCQEAPSSIEISENIYEFPFDEPMPQPCNEMSNIQHSLDNSEKLPNEEYPESQVGGFHYDIPKRLQDYPATKLKNEDSKVWHSTEDSMKLSIDEFSEVQSNTSSEIGHTYKGSLLQDLNVDDDDDEDDLFCTGQSPDIPLKDKSPEPPCARRSSESQPNTGTWHMDMVLEELKMKQEAMQCRRQLSLDSP